MYVSVITLAELRYGIERISPGKRRTQLGEWLRADLPLRFERRILPVDAAVSDRWGRLVARCESKGRPIHAMDAQLAATAEVHLLKLVTRNSPDFVDAVRSVINPWK